MASKEIKNNKANHNRLALFIKMLDVLNRLENKVEIIKTI